MIVKKILIFLEDKVFSFFFETFDAFSIGTPFHSLAPVYFIDFLPRVVIHVL